MPVTRKQKKIPFVPEETLLDEYSRIKAMRSALLPNRRDNRLDFAERISFLFGSRMPYLRTIYEFVSSVAEGEVRADDESTVLIAYALRHFLTYRPLAQCFIDFKKSLGLPRGGRPSRSPKQLLLERRLVWNILSREWKGDSTREAIAVAIKEKGSDVGVQGNRRRARSLMKEHREVLQVVRRLHDELHQSSIQLDCQSEWATLCLDVALLERRKPATCFLTLANGSCIIRNRCRAAQELRAKPATRVPSSTASHRRRTKEHD